MQFLSTKINRRLLTPRRVWIVRINYFSC